MAAKRKRIKMLVEVSVKLDEDMPLTNSQWRKEVKTMINEGSGYFTSPGEFMKAISVKPVKVKTYPKEVDNSQRNMDWLQKK